MTVRRVNYRKDAHKENADSIANEQGGVLSMGEIDQQAKLVTAVVRARRFNLWSTQLAPMAPTRRPVFRRRSAKDPL